MSGSRAALSMRRASRAPGGFIAVCLRSDVRLPLMGSGLCAGFPSPADDYVEHALDPSRLIVTNPTATFMWKVCGISMVRAGILDGDYVVVDRSLIAKAGDVVVAVIDGMPSAKLVTKDAQGRLALDFADAKRTPLILDESSEALIWGVVTWSLTPHRPPGR